MHTHTHPHTHTFTWTNFYADAWTHTHTNKVWRSHRSREVKKTWWRLMKTEWKLNASLRVTGRQGRQRLDHWEVRLCARSRLAQLRESWHSNKWRGKTGHFTYFRLWICILLARHAASTFCVHSDSLLQPNYYCNAVLLARREGYSMSGERALLFLLKDLNTWATWVPTSNL